MSASAILQALASGVMLGGVYALVAMSLALVFGVMRVLNFAHGDLLMCAMYGVVVVCKALQVNPYVAGLILIPVMAAVGYVLFITIIRPVLKSGPLMQAQLTIGLSFAIQSAALLIFGADLLNVRTSFEGEVLRFGGIVLGVPEMLGFLVAIALSGAISWFLLKTETGYRIRAVAQDPVMAVLCGIRVPKVQAGVFAGCIALLAIPAGCLMAFYQLTPNVGIQFSLLSLMVVVLGGLGDLKGAFVGGLLLGVVESLTAMLVNGAAAPGAIYLVFGLALLLRPRGLFGRGAAA